MMEQEAASAQKTGRIRADELASKTFEDELDLAYAVIDGIQVRGEAGKYSTQRVRFNSNSSG